MQMFCGDGRPAEAPADGSQPNSGGIPGMPPIEVIPVLLSHPAMRLSFAYAPFRSRPSHLLRCVPCGAISNLFRLPVRALMAL